MILQSGDSAGHNIKLIAFLCLNSVTMQARWAGSLSSWKIKLLFGKCRATTGQNSDSSMSMYFCAFMLPSMTHIVPTPFQVIHAQITRHPILAGLSPNIETVTFSYHDLTFVTKYHSIPFSFNSPQSLSSCLWHTFFAVVVANSYFLSNDPSMIIIFI